MMTMPVALGSSPSVILSKALVVRLFFLPLRGLGLYVSFVVYLNIFCSKYFLRCI